jgi:hypothetical protein
MSLDLDKMRAFWDSPKGKLAMENYGKELVMKEDRKRRRMEFMKKAYSNQEEFDSLMGRICNKHDDRWDAVCYSKGYQPYPWNILYTMYDIAEEHGNERDTHLDGLTEHFPSYIYHYMGWHFAVTHGQGSVLSIYKSEELKARI